MEVELPDDFRCPISLEVMTDPVILASGHTFDRPSIQRWLDSGNRTCPVTNLPLPPSPRLIPNHALRSLISNFTPPSSSPSPSPSPPPPPSSAAADPRALLAALVFPSDAATLAAVLRLVKRSPSFRRLVADSGAASVLLRHAAASGDRPDLQDLALRAVLHLSLDGDDARVGLVADGAVDSVVAALRGPAAALAATTLTSLAVVEVNKCTIGAHPAAVPGLAALLRQGAAARERREAATALYELCKFPENRMRAVRAGAVPALVRLAGEGSERAVEVLGLLAKCREGKEEMKKVANFVGVLVELLRIGSSRSIHHSLLALNLVCSDSREMALEATKEGALELSLALLGDGNEKIAKNAAALTQTLEKEQFRGWI